MAKRFCAEIHVVAFLANHGDVVAHTMKFAVMRYKVRKGVGLIGDQLDMQPSLAVAFVNKVLQLLDFLRLNGLFCVLPHAMAGEDGFFKVIGSI